VASSIAIWVVLSAVLDPLFYIFAGPHIPPGRMTNTANGAQFDFNVLFVHRHSLSFWACGPTSIYAIVMWRCLTGWAGTGRRAGGPRQPLDPGVDGS
jgi:hypothetical protein